MLPNRDLLASALVVLVVSTTASSGSWSEGGDVVSIRITTGSGVARALASLPSLIGFRPPVVVLGGTDRPSKATDPSALTPLADDSQARDDILRAQRLFDSAQAPRVGVAATPTSLDKGERSDPSGTSASRIRDAEHAPCSDGGIPRTRDEDLDEPCGFLDIMVVGGAKVSEGGRVLCARTPCSGIALSPGTHRLQLESSSDAKRTVVVIIRGRATTYSRQRGFDETSASGLRSFD